MRTILIALGLCLLAATAVADDETEATIDKLVADLASSKWATRDKATKALIALGPDAVAPLRRRWSAAKDIEVKARLEDVLREFGAIRPTDRAAFAKAMSGISEGMPGKKIRRILGNPDDIRTHEDPGGISTARTKEIWRYGTSGHMTSATLGEIYIDQAGKAQYVYGGGQAVTGFGEPALRRLLAIMGRLTSYNAGWSYDPLPVIQTVNALLPLGKARALAAIGEFLRVTSSWNPAREGLFLALRMLFAVPKDPGYMPRMLVGGPSPAEPADRKLLPRFPLAVQGDIPFLMVNGYRLAGQAEQVESHVEKFRASGTLRKAPLRPAADPFAALDALAKTKRWLFADSKYPDSRLGRQMLSSQVLSLIATVHRSRRDRYGSRVKAGKKGEPELEKHIAAFRKAETVWDAKASRYTLKDGSVLPPQKRPRRRIFKPRVPAGMKLRVILEREDDERVAVTLEISWDGTAKVKVKGKIRIVAVAAPDKPVCELAVDPAAQAKWVGPGGFSSSSDRSFKIASGTKVRVEWVSGKKTQKSPDYTP